MRLIFNDDKSVTIDMDQYTKETIEEFSEIINKSVTTTASEYLFKVDPMRRNLGKKRKRYFIGSLLNCYSYVNKLDWIFQ